MLCKFQCSTIAILSCHLLQAYEAKQACSKQEKYQMAIHNECIGMYLLPLTLNIHVQAPFQVPHLLLMILIVPSFKGKPKKLYHPSMRQNPPYGCVPPTTVIASTVTMVPPAR